MIENFANNCLITSIQDALWRAWQCR